MHGSPHNVIKPRRSTKLSSFNDVQNAMPQKIRSACLHDSLIGTYPIYIRFISTYEWGPNQISLYPNACVFFLFTLSYNRSDLCHIWAKNRNWVTFIWQCKDLVHTAGLNAHIRFLRCCSHCHQSHVWTVYGPEVTRIRRRRRDVRRSALCLRK